MPSNYRDALKAYVSATDDYFVALDAYEKHRDRLNKARTLVAAAHDALIASADHGDLIPVYHEELFGKKHRNNDENCTNI